MISGRLSEPWRSGSAAISLIACRMRVSYRKAATSPNSRKLNSRMAAMSAFAGPERRIFEPARSDDAPLSCEFGLYLVVDLSHKRRDFPIRNESRIVALFNRVEPFFGGRSKPFELKLLLLLAFGHTVLNDQFFQPCVQRQPLCCGFGLHHCGQFG